MFGNTSFSFGSVATNRSFAAMASSAYRLRVTVDGACSNTCATSLPGQLVGRLQQPKHGLDTLAHCNNVMRLGPHECVHTKGPLLRAILVNVLKRCNHVVRTCIRSYHIDMFMFKYAYRNIVTYTRHQQQTSELVEGVDAGQEARHKVVTARL